MISLYVRGEAENWWWYHTELHQCIICYKCRYHSNGINSDIAREQYPDIAARGLFLMSTFKYIHSKPKLITVSWEISSCERTKRETHHPHQICHWMSFCISPRVEFSNQNCIGQMCFKCNCSVFVKFASLRMRLRV